MNTPRWHALNMRRLIEACGGLDEATAIVRVSRAQLSRYQTPGSGCMPTTDVVMALEEYCGQPIYSRAMADARPSAGDATDLLALACMSSEEGADVLRAIREGVADGTLSPREIDAAREQIAEQKALLSRLEAGLAAAETAQP